jgi:Tfp pilus assembly protein PilV
MKTEILASSNKGQSLIEIVVAVGIIAVVLVGVSDLITRSLGLSSFQAKKNEATNIAQSQLNKYRQARDMEPTRFFSADNPQKDFSLCETLNLKYTCTIGYDYTGVTNGVKMTVGVEWTDGDKNVTTELSQVLFKPTK